MWQIYLPFHIIILIFFTSQGWAEQSNTFGQYYWSTSKRVVKILGVFHHHTNFLLLRLRLPAKLKRLSVTIVKKKWKMKIWIKQLISALYIVYKTTMQLMHTKLDIGQALTLTFSLFSSLFPLIAFHPLQGYPRSWFFYGHSYLAQLEGICINIQIMSTITLLILNIYLANHAVLGEISSSRITLFRAKYLAEIIGSGEVKIIIPPWNQTTIAYNMC